MNYKKIREQLKKQNLIDDNNLICHSHRSYTATKDRVIFMELTRIGNEKRMPAFMLLSIKDDRLNICFAKGFGGFKKYYASFELSKLKFEASVTVDRVVDIYKFNVLDVDEYTVFSEFYIISNMHKDDTKKLVDYIIKYNKENSLN